jgi:hypothetical protein
LLWSHNAEPPAEETKQARGMSSEASPQTDEP